MSAATQPALHPGPFAGVRVLDFTNMMSGPYCTRLLADLGAEVIKVEPPEGDHNRSRRPVRNGYSSFFGQLNAGKKCIVLNLKSAVGVATAKALAQKCDIVVENWRPGVAIRLGVGYKALSEGRSDLIYCSISGFGQTGPKSLRPAYAPMVHAASGFDHAQMGYQKADQPANTATFTGDLFGGISAFSAVQAAYIQRLRTGRGQYLDVSLFDGMLNILVYEVQEAQAPTDEKVRVYQPLKTIDGHIVLAPTSQKNFELLARSVGHPEWIEDPRFSRTRAREAHWGELMDLIGEWTKVRTGLECEDHLLADGVPCSRYMTVAEAIADPQVVYRGSMTKVVDPAGSYLIPNAPFAMPGTDAAPKPHIPQLGEHGQEILGGLLGYGPSQIKQCAVRASTRPTAEETES